MPDPRMDAALDYVSGVHRELLSDRWTIAYMELLAVELLCTPPANHDQIAKEMLSVIRGD